MIGTVAVPTKRGQHHHHHHQQEEALLAVYVGALASLSLQAVARRQAPDGSSSSMEVEEEPAEYLWCEQPPLAMALGLSPSTLARPILAEASFFASTQLPCAPESAGTVIAAAQCPLVVSVILESRCTFMVVVVCEVAAFD